MTGGNAKQAGRHWDLEEVHRSCEFIRNPTVGLPVGTNLSIDPDCASNHRHAPADRPGRGRRRRTEWLPGIQPQTPRPCCGSVNGPAVDRRAHEAPRPSGRLTPASLPETPIRPFCRGAVKPERAAWWRGSRLSQMVVSERAVVSSRAAFGRPQGDPPRAAQLESDDYWISAGSSCMRCH